MAGLGLKPSSPSPSALDTSGALPESPSVGCNSKPGALGSKAGSFPLALRSQELHLTASVHRWLWPHLPPLSAGSSHPKGLHTPAAGGYVVFFPPIHPQTELMCVSCSSGTWSSPKTWQEALRDRRGGSIHCKQLVHHGSTF